MAHKDWARIEEIFQAAFDLSVEQRAAYLESACPKDPSLRAEVETLFAALDKHSDFLEKPVLSLGLQVISETTPVETRVGKVIGAYRILAPLGIGAQSGAKIPFTSVDE